MAVIDLRDNRKERKQQALMQSFQFLLSGISKLKEQEVTKGVIGVLNRPGLTPQQRTDELLKIPNFAESKIGNMMTQYQVKQNLMYSGLSEDERARAQRIDLGLEPRASSYISMYMLNHWQSALNKAKNTGDKKTEAFAQQQINQILEQINPEWSPPTEPIEMEKPRKEGWWDYFFGGEKESEPFVGPPEPPVGPLRPQSSQRKQRGTRGYYGFVPPANKKADAEIAEEFTGPPEPMPGERLKYDAGYAAREPEQALEHYRQFMTPDKFDEQDLKDLLEIFRQGDISKIQEAIRRIGAL